MGDGRRGTRPRLPLWGAAARSSARGAHGRGAFLRDVPPPTPPLKRTHALDAVSEKPPVKSNSIKGKTNKEKYTVEFRSYWSQNGLRVRAFSHEQKLSEESKPGGGKN